MKLKAACSINSKEVIVNSKQILTFDSNETDWKKNIYKYLELDYPKFHKMDALSKMAICGFKLIESEIDITKYNEEEISLLFANRSSSYYSDNKHNNNFKNLNTISPSDFVYTLPNILTGEISILNKWYGENVFFIAEKFDFEFFKTQINFYFYKGAKACLCGWIESNQEYEEAILFFIENEKGEITKEELEKYIKIK